MEAEETKRQTTAEETEETNDGVHADDGRISEARRKRRRRRYAGDGKQKRKRSE
ncbi:predicted protein [Arabidopsis lyrata subsp. lyrata]|uniref:Predicted protein n=1 Tax=Arabidopsis lyrata subsp. lyrata TaxID=81972 RepID=D7ML03_ARALL|nr:predicted protein [Arabidopsis lyrata subsp. lyrata]